ncbi:hypothetical protein FW774_01705 (plasmid) [Pedobacter sp. BS3]|uniref:hypothetical protein n=1 Tax=Pedobacter sp. BS3 TaxID=2567937 RepID=UPI0011EDE89D|nr:hypothetical protein [Pedobacter sp. BS3]TZF85812.1 hypothetical protein FW774_01705 [Pedobacter sp. BS3]
MKKYVLVLCAVTTLLSCSKSKKRDDSPTSQSSLLSKIIEVESTGKELIKTEFNYSENNQLKEMIEHHYDEGIEGNRYVFNYNNDVIQSIDAYSLGTGRHYATINQFKFNNNHPTHFVYNFLGFSDADQYAQYYMINDLSYANNRLTTIVAKSYETYSNELNQTEISTYNYDNNGKLINIHKATEFPLSGVSRDTITFKSYDGKKSILSPFPEWFMVTMYSPPTELTSSPFGNILEEEENGDGYYYKYQYEYGYNEQGYPITSTSVLYTNNQLNLSISYRYEYK